MDIFCISKHRTALMGIATLMVIACHAPASGVVLPNVLGRLLGLGNFGVDIFLFLSGLGCYYSLLKTTIRTNYLKKRYIRIGIPYLLITLPYIIIFLLLGQFSLREAILSLTTLDYWIEHRGAWFVALLIPLYFLSPILFRILSGKRFLWNLILMTVCVMLLCCYSINVDSGTCGNVIENIQSALQRVPSYFLGMVFGKLSKDKCNINESYLKTCIIGGGILYLGCYFLLRKIFVGWMVVPLLIFIMGELLDSFPLLSKVLTPLGRISLESYLANIYINHILCVIIPSQIDYEIFYGRYLEYSIVMVLGLAIAFPVNRMSAKIIESVMKTG